MTTIKAIMFHPEIKRFVSRLEKRANSATARTVVAKELGKIVYHAVKSQQPFGTFKGIAIEKLRNWPRLVSPCA